MRRGRDFYNLFFRQLNLSLRFVDPLKNVKPHKGTDAAVLQVRPL
jgi:hypothetical protein